MTISHDDFHLEEYRQLRAEWAVFIGRNETLARYGFVGAGVVYAWLVVEGFGIGTSGACLELPQKAFRLAWFIPAAVTFLTGCLAGTQTYRAHKITQYLEKLESKLGYERLGWERWIRSTPNVLTLGVGLTWLVFFFGTLIIGFCASGYIGNLGNCQPPVSN